MRALLLYLRDMDLAMGDAEAFVGDLDMAEFVQDRKTVCAVMLSFIALGEAAKHVPASLRDSYPEVPWRELAGMRDRLTHAYFDADDKLLWRSVKEDFPLIRPAIQAMIRELGEASP